MKRDADPELSSRREFIIKTIQLVSIVSLPACKTSPSLPTTDLAHDLFAENTAAEAYSPGFFTAEEWRFINSACSRLIPDDETGPGAAECGVPEFIDRQLHSGYGQAERWYMQGPFIAASPEFGYQGSATPREMYRTGISAMNNYCILNQEGKQFPDCDASIQDRLLKAMEDGRIELENIDGKTFFAWLLQNTKEGYLSDPVHGGNKNMGAWRMIGFPGARADFSDWVTRHGDRYPLDPVSLSGGFPEPGT